MKQKHLFFLIGILPCMIVGCKDEYRDYEKIYDNNGTVILVSKSKRLKDGPESLKTIPYNDMKLMHSGFPFVIDPSSGRQIQTEDAKTYINNYQDSVKNGSTRYVDFYFPNLQNYIESIQKKIQEAKINDSKNQTNQTPQEILDTTQYGIRIYFAKHNDSNCVIFGPIKVQNIEKNATEQQVDPLWVTDSSNYKAFNFGSLCPQNCTNKNDLTGYALP